MSGHQTRQIVDLSRQVNELQQQRDALVTAMRSAVAHIELGTYDFALITLVEQLERIK